MDNTAMRPSKVMLLLFPVVKLTLLSLFCLNKYDMAWAVSLLFPSGLVALSLFLFLEELSFQFFMLLSD